MRVSGTGPSSVILSQNPFLVRSCGKDMYKVEKLKEDTWEP